MAGETDRAIPGGTHDLRHRRRRLHRLEFRARLARAFDEPVVNLDKLTYAGNLANLAASRRPAASSSCAGTLTTTRSSAASRGAPAAGNPAFRRGEPCRSLHSRPRRVYSDQRGRHVQPARRSARILEELARRRKERGSASCTSRRTRYTARSDRTTPPSPKPRPIAEQSIRSVQGQLGPSRAGVAPHLWLADTHHQLFEQLWTVPVSGEADPADDPERDGGKAACRYMAMGENVRDWLYVRDHCAGIRAVLERGRPGEVYNIGGKANVRTSRSCGRSARCSMSFLPRSSHRPHERLITFVKDRPGHDRRYAIDCRKIRRELGWHRPSVRERHATDRRVVSVISEWVKGVQSGEYRDGSRRTMRRGRASRPSTLVPQLSLRSMATFAKRKRISPSFWSAPTPVRRSSGGEQ